MKKKTDLLIKNRKENTLGRFSKLITFPIHNFSNEIVGFASENYTKFKN